MIFYERREGDRQYLRNSLGQMTKDADMRQMILLCIVFLQFHVIVEV